jgi:hypothetical protein
MSHRCIVAVIVGTLVVAAGIDAGAAPKKSSASLLYERRMEAYQRDLAAYQQQQSEAALRAADALAAKLEALRQSAIHAAALKRYQHDQYLAARGAAQRLSEKLERLYGRHDAEVATHVRPASDTAVVSLAIASQPPAVKVAPKPQPRRSGPQRPVHPAVPLPVQTRPAVSALPTTPIWYGWGEL